MRPFSFRFLVAAAVVALSTAAAAEGLSFDLTYQGNHQVSKLRDAVDLKLHEPSGLALRPSGELLTVDDDGKRFYVVDLFKRPEVKRTKKKVEVEGEGFEGIAYGGPDVVFAVEESRRQIIAIDARDGKLIASRELLEMEGSDALPSQLSEGETNKGLEGIAIHPETGVLHVVNEGRPRLLMMISPNLETVLDHHELSPAAGFVIDGVDDDDLDVSGLAFDPRDGRLWIVSDQGASVFRYSIEERRAVGRPLFLEKGGERKPVLKAEGVAFDARRSRLYVITDRDEGSEPLLIEYDVE